MRQTCSSNPHIPVGSIAFYVAVNAAHEHGGAQVTKGSTHGAQPKAKHGGVAEVKRRLEEARHLRLGKEIVNAVQEHVPAATHKVSSAVAELA